jgi:hypothetical protein
MSLPHLLYEGYSWTTKTIQIQLGTFSECFMFTITLNNLVKQNEDIYTPPSCVKLQLANQLVDI